MAVNRFDKAEQEFMMAVGLDSHDVEHLVAGAPPAAAEAQARIRERVRRKVGLVDVTPRAARPREQSRPRALRWLPAAAAALLVVGAAFTAAGSPTAQAALQRLLHLVPGFGIMETDGQMLVLAAPVTAPGPRGDLTVTALISQGEYTEVRFRIDGLPMIKPDPATMDGEPVRAALVLPDGRRIDQTGAGTGVGEVLRGTLWFPALPTETHTVTLDLKGMHGLTDPYVVALNLVDVGHAGLSEASTGGWSLPQNGVTLGAPYMTVEQDRITLLLQTGLGQTDARVSEVGGASGRLALTDDLGHSYELLRDESVLGSSTYGLSAVFVGPLHDGAAALRLTVDALQVEEKGEARLRVPLSRLAVGQTAQLNEELRVGSHTIVVRSVTRLEEQRFALDLDLGAEQDGAILEYVRIQPYRGSGGSSMRFDPATEKQASEFEVSYTPDGKYLDLLFSQPTVEIQGPWQIELPIN